MSRYQKVPNPDKKPCEFTGVAAAATWYFWVERSSTSDGKLARRWYAGGEVGSSFRRKVAELKARASQDGFEIIAWSRGAPLPVAAATVVAGEDPDGTSMTAPPAPEPATLIPDGTSMTAPPAPEPATLIAPPAAPVPMSSSFPLVPFTPPIVATPALVLEALNLLLLQQPRLVAELNARLPPGFTMPAPQPSTVESMALVPAPSQSILTAAVIDSKQCHNLRQKFMRTLLSRDLCSAELRDLSDACSPSGSVCACQRCHGQHAIICLNAHGTEPEHLAGQCWSNDGRIWPKYTSYVDPEYGADVLAMLAGGTDTLLVRTARCGREKAMAVLLEARADVNQENGFGSSPLFAACLASQVGTVRLLHKAGACLSFRHPIMLLTLLEVAVRDFEDGLREINECYEEYEEAEDEDAELGPYGFLECGGPGIRLWKRLPLNPTCLRNFDAFAEYYDLPLGRRSDIAKHHSMLAVVTYLLEECQLTPIAMEWCATHSSHHPLISFMNTSCTSLTKSRALQDLVLLLLKHGFGPNIQVSCSPSLCKWTPSPPRCTILHVACLMAGQDRFAHKLSDGITMIRLLLEGNGDPTIMNSHGETPLQYAQRRHQKVMLELLIKYIPWSRANALCDEACSSSAPLLAKPSSSSSEPQATSVSAAPMEESKSVESPSALGKRMHRTTPMLTRAYRVGVADQLKPWPETPIRTGEGDESLIFAEHKKSKAAVQRANQQIVARAEAKLHSNLRRL